MPYHNIYIFLITYAVCYVLIDAFIINYFRDLFLFKIKKISTEGSLIEVLVPRNKYLVELFKCYFCLGFWVGLFIYSIDCGITLNIIRVRCLVLS